MSNPTLETTEDALHRGMQRARVYDWAAASEAFRKAVALDSEATEPRFRLGWSLWNQADAERPTLANIAVVYGAQVLGFDQTARDGKRKFQSYRQLLDDSVQYLRTVIERDPSHARAHHYLSKALNGLDRRAEAEAAAQKAAEIDPQNSAYTTFAQSFSQPATNRNTQNGTAPTEPVVPPIDNATLTWDDLVLNPKTKRELRQMQLMLEKPDLARELGVQTPAGILLKGPPGTGKTTIARILANESRCNFFSTTPADINQSYVGESEKRVRDLFDKARANPPAIIFVDEIDALLPSRQGGIAIHSDKVVTQFLQEMDGLTQNTRVFLIGAPKLRRNKYFQIMVQRQDADFNAYCCGKYFFDARKQLMFGRINLVANGDVAHTRVLTYLHSVPSCATSARSCSSSSRKPGSSTNINASSTSAIAISASASYVSLPSSSA